MYGKKDGFHGGNVNVMWNGVKNGIKTVTGKRTGKENGMSYGKHPEQTKSYGKTERKIDQNGGMAFCERKNTKKHIIGTRRENDGKSKCETENKRFRAVFQ